MPLIGPYLLQDLQRRMTIVGAPLFPAVAGLIAPVALPGLDQDALAQVADDF